MKAAELLHIGQWQGFFSYGAEYGDTVAGKEAEFRMFIEHFENGHFSGRVIDWAGFGADGNVSELTGFILGDVISFTKRYSEGVYYDAAGNTHPDPELDGYQVHYEGHYDTAAASFIGIWEIH